MNREEDTTNKDKPATFEIKIELSPFLDICIGITLLLLSLIPLAHAVRWW